MTFEQNEYVDVKIDVQHNLYAVHCVDFQNDIIYFPKS